MRVYACKQLQVQTSPRSTHKPSGISQFWNFLSVFSIGSTWSMVSGQFCWPTVKSEGGLVNHREGQIITEYLAVLVESRIKCETTHTSPDILTEKGLMPWTKAIPLKKTTFPPKFCNEICTIYVWTMKIDNSEKKNENVVPFQNGGQITDFYFASVFGRKFETPLSQRNFSMKFGSK